MRDFRLRVARGGLTRGWKVPRRRGIRLLLFSSGTDSSFGDVFMTRSCEDPGAGVNDTLLFGPQPNEGNAR